MALLIIHLNTIIKQIDKANRNKKQIIGTPIKNNQE